MPPGASVVELKYCEVCGQPFARERGARRRDCRECELTPLRMDLSARIQQLEREAADMALELNALHVYWQQ